EFLNWLIFQFFPPSIAHKIRPIPTQHITKAITSALGTYEQAFDSDIGNNFHKFAGVLNRLGAELVAVAQLEVTIAHRIIRIETHAAHDRRALHHVAGQVQTANKRIAETNRHVRAERKRATKAEHKITTDVTRVSHYVHH